MVFDVIADGRFRATIVHSNVPFASSLPLPLGVPLRLLYGVWLFEYFVFVHNAFVNIRNVAVPYACCFGAFGGVLSANERCHVYLR